MLAGCATVYYNRCLLWRSYFAKLQILVALLPSVLQKLFIEICLLMLVEWLHNHWKSACLECNCVRRKEDRVLMSLSICRNKLEYVMGIHISSSIFVCLLSLICPIYWVNRTSVNMVLVLYSCVNFLNNDKHHLLIYVCLFLCRLIIQSDLLAQIPQANWLLLGRYFDVFFSFPKFSFWGWFWLVLCRGCSIILTVNCSKLLIKITGFHTIRLQLMLWPYGYLINQNNRGGRK